MPTDTADPARAGPRDPDGRAVDSVMRAVAFVEERMGEDVGAEDMASAACYSPFYFSRLFLQATGHSPYDYLMRRRVAAAADEVVTGARSLIDIALDRGFEVPETFARAFRRCFGLVPSEARREGSYPRSTARTRIQRSYVEAMLTWGPPIPEAVESEATTVEGRWMRGDEPAPSERDGGVLVVERDGALRPAAVLSGSYISVDRLGPAPAYPLTSTSIAGGRRARFRVGSAERLDFTVEFAYRVWLPSVARARPPAFDLVEADAGGALSLALPLD